MKITCSLILFFLFAAAMSALAQGGDAGRVDTSFDPGIGPNADVYGVMVQSDRRIVIAGNFGAVRGSQRRGVARFNEDGSLDALTGTLQRNNGFQGIVSVSDKPVIDISLQSRSVSNGTDVSFTVSVSGIAPFTYLWKLNGKAIPGATNAVLDITNAQLANVGVYTVTVENSAGSATSVQAFLTVDGISDPDRKLPGLSIVSPKGVFIRSPSNHIIFNGTAKDNFGIAAVCYQQETNPWVQIPLATNWSVDITLQPGTNRFRVKATDLFDHNTPTQTVIVFYVVTNFITLNTNCHDMVGVSYDSGAGAIMGVTNGQGLEIGRGYSIKAKPASNIVFSNWVVAGNGIFYTSTNPTLGFLMQSNLQVCANFFTNPFIALAGQHSAIFVDGSGAWDKSGSVSFTLTPGGTYSGKLMLGGGAYPFSGAFDLALVSKKIVTNKKTNVALVCLQLFEGSDLVSGSVSNAGFDTALFGHRAGFNKKHPATNFAGRYTLLYNATTNPPGYSVGTATVANDGTFSFTGDLADGTPLTFSTPVAADGSLGINTPLYQGKGSFFTLMLLSIGGATDINLAFARWTKTTLTSGAFYRGGVTNYLQLVGKRNMAPPKGTAALTFRNAIVRIEGANLTTILTNDVMLTAKNTVTVTAPNTNKLSITVDAAKGTFKGSFKNPVTGKTSPIKGVLSQTTVDYGAGFSLGTNQSATVYFGLPENFPPSFGLGP